MARYGRKGRGGGVLSRLKRGKYRMKSRGQKRMARSMSRVRGRGQLSELKFVDTNIAAMGANATTSLWEGTTTSWKAMGVAPGACTTALNGIATGAGATQRIGKKIFMKTLQIRGFVRRPAVLPTSITANDVEPFNFRIIIIYDKQPSPTAFAPAGSDVFTADNLIGIRKLDNADRFAILLDETFVVGTPSYIITATTIAAATAGTSAAANSNCWFERFIKINLPTTYSETGGATLQNINTGSLLVMTCWQGGAIANPAEGSWNFRLRYVDA